MPKDGTQAASLALPRAIHYDGSMGFREIENDIKSGALDAAIPILLYGEERFLVDHYEKQLMTLFGGGRVSELDLCVFHGDETDDEAILSALDTFPMISPVRVVVVRNHPGFSASGGELSDCLPQLPKTARLLFSAGSVNKTRALYKAVSKHGRLYEFTRLNEADLTAFAKKRFRAMGAELAPDILHAFCLATGYLEKDTQRDLFAVENDVYKLASFALSEGRTAITSGDLEECMPGILRTDVFAMLDAISAGRKGEAIRLLENSLAGGESVFRLLPLLTGHFEIMLGYKELSGEGKGAAEITRLLGERSDWRVKKLGGFAQRFDATQLKRILGRLYGMERDIKSGDIADRLALTVLFAEI